MSGYGHQKSKGIYYFLPCKLKIVGERIYTPVILRIAKKQLEIIIQKEVNKKKEKK